jgi:hypothetical protein
MTHKLTVRFAGICTHFRRGAVAGVPHRVVLPDASRFITDLLTVAESPVPEPILYYLMPHFPQLEVWKAQVPLNVPAFEQTGSMAVKDGDILTRIRLQVANAIDRELSYADDDDTPSLSSFVNNYTFSTDVVLNGGAACYFDLFGGKVCSTVTPGGATQTFIEIETDGPPELLVTPLASSTAYAPIGASRLLLGDHPEVTLIVKNLEVAERERKLDHQGGAFDFLLHYLTASGGIPRTLKSVTPGMRHTNLVSATRADLARALQGMGDILRHPTKRVLVHPDEVTPSCSDSRYP